MEVSWTDKCINWGSAITVIVDDVMWFSPGVHRLQWLGIQKNGLHSSSFSSAGQSVFGSSSWRSLQWIDCVWIAPYSVCEDVFLSLFLFPVDPRGDQLSEGPGFSLLYVCAAVLLGVNVRHRLCSRAAFVFRVFHFHLPVRRRCLIRVFVYVWAGWSRWRCSTASFCWERLVCSLRRPKWRKSSPTLHPLLSPAVQTPELTAPNTSTRHHSKVSLSFFVCLCVCVSLSTSLKNQIGPYDALLPLLINIFPLSNRTSHWQRRTFIGIGQPPTRPHGRERRAHTTQEQLGRVPDHARRRGRRQNHQHRHRNGRGRTQTQNAQERLAGDRPLHHLWQPYRLNAAETRSQCPGNAARFRDQTRVMENARTGLILMQLTPRIFIDIYYWLNQPRHNAVTTSNHGPCRTLPTRPSTR